MAKLLFISLLLIFKLLFPIDLIASETDHSSFLTSQVGGGHLIEQVSAEEYNHQTSTSVTFQSRSEVYEVILGTFMIIIGLVALALALYRWNPKDLSLIAFGRRFL